MSETLLHIHYTSNVLLIIIFCLSPIIFTALFFINAPYGRYVIKEDPHRQRKTKPRALLSKRAAWLIMEIPAVLTILLFWILSPVGLFGLLTNKTHPLVFMGFSLYIVIWQFHYIYRTFITTFLSQNEKNNFRIYIVVMGVLFNGINGFLNGWEIFFKIPMRSPEILLNPELIFSRLLSFHFFAGLGIFITGFVMHAISDAELRRMKRESYGGYAIPNAFLHRYVASPNYLGEIIQWWGWALLTWSVAGTAFALFTMANLVPRAFSNLQWYRKKFNNYPLSRKAIIPFII